MGLMLRLFGGHKYLEVRRGDHGLSDYCTVRVKAANEAQSVRVNTACRKDHSLRYPIYQNWYCGVAAYITWPYRFRCLKESVILFISSRCQAAAGVSKPLIKPIFEH